MSRNYSSFYKKLNSMNRKDYIENFLILNTSLVIADIKPSVTINIMKNDDYKKWLDYGRAFINNIGLGYIELREIKSSVILLIYNKKLLSKSIFEENSKNFLMQLGYPDNVDINDWLKVLKDRYDRYHCPHELGIFLGFPIDDVQDFMNCTNKKCLLCGYWKVYNNLNIAKETFNKYDTVKNITIKHLNEEVTNTSEIVNNIKSLIAIDKVNYNI